jgi:hypothetical protein
MDYILFHSPYNKLVQKSFGRLLYQDMLSGAMDKTPIEPFLSLSKEKSYEDKKLEDTLKKLSAEGYSKKVDISCKISKQIGNTYTASVWMNLANLVSTLGNGLLNKEIVLFSYGSGALASMLQVIPREGCDVKFSLENIQKQLNVMNRLATREKLTPEDLSIALKAREESHLGEPPFLPKFANEKLFPGTYYLTEITKNYERMYSRKPLNSHQMMGGSLMKKEENEYDNEVGVNIDDASPTPTGSDSQKAIVRPSTSFSTSVPLSLLNSNSTSPLPMMGRLTRNQTVVWASGRRNVSVVVTGVSAALPGRNNDVFKEGVNNIQKILNGESCITEIPNHVKDSMLEKNLFLTIKDKSDPTGKKTMKIPIASYDSCINVSATLGNFDLAKSYGIAESLVSTMDRAVQVAIAAGLEALKDAHLVTGIKTEKGESGWVLPVSMQNSTGIVYATSFPALDTAIEEVSRYFKSKTIDNILSSQIIPSLRKRLINSLKDDQSSTLSEETEKALAALEEFLLKSVKDEDDDHYEFDRKFLFRVLVLGNAQLAQIIKAKGPNMQTNAACAG